MLSSPLTPMVLASFVRLLGLSVDSTWFAISITIAMLLFFILTPAYIRWEIERRLRAEKEKKSRREK